MMRPVSSRKLILTLFVLSLLISTSACTPRETTPSAWIDFPKDGTRFDKPGSITVTAHAAASTGVGYIIFSVNSVPYSQHSPAVEGAGFADFTIPWMPTEDGSYSLEVSMYDVNGNFGGSASSRVQIGVLEPDDPRTVSPIITVTPVISDTPTPPPDIPTPTYTPTATSTVAAPITITVNAPSDTTPPPVPQPMVPSNGLHITCKASQSLVWLPVSDPGGILGYDVELLKSVSGNWQSVQKWNGVSGKQVDAPIDCGLEYRWAVRAVDNAGNQSAWSNWVTFVIDLS